LAALVRCTPQTEFLVGGVRFTSLSTSPQRRFILGGVKEFCQRGLWAKILRSAQDDRRGGDDDTLIRFTPFSTFPSWEGYNDS
jgi:hypothetical protein